MGTKEETWRTAIHEAGHAVVAHEVGVPLASVSIVPGETFNGIAFNGIASLALSSDEIRLAFDDSYDDSAEDLDPRQRADYAFVFAVRQIMVSFGGKVAEALFFGGGDRRTWASDLDAIGTSSERVCPPGPDEVMIFPANVTADEAQALADKWAKETPPSEQQLFATWLERRTTKLLKLRRPVVERLARRLVDVGTLSAKETRSVILNGPMFQGHLRSALVRGGTKKATGARGDGARGAKEPDAPTRGKHKKKALPARGRRQPT